MPTYEYRCPKGHEFEVFQRISDEPGAKCPECGEPAERLLSAGAGLLFKGSGFYITDYRSDSYKKSASSEKPAGSESKSKESGSSSKESGSSSKEPGSSSKESGSSSKGSGSSAKGSGSSKSGE